MNIVRWISGKFTKYETAYAFCHTGGVGLRRIPQLGCDGGIAGFMDITEEMQICCIYICCLFRQ